MDLLTISWILWLVFVGFEIGLRVERRKHKLPYKWSCMEEDCVFLISTGNWEMLMFLADGHLESAHGIEQT